MSLNAECMRDNLSVHFYDDTFKRIHCVRKKNHFMKLTKSIFNLIQTSRSIHFINAPNCSWLPTIGLIIIIIIHYYESFALSFRLKSV